MQLVVEDRVTDEEYYQVRRTQMLKNELAELEARSLTLDDESKKSSRHGDRADEGRHALPGRSCRRSCRVRPATTQIQLLRQAFVCASPHRHYLGSGLDFKLSKSYLNA